MSEYAIRVERNIITGNIVEAVVYNTETGRTKNIQGWAIESKLGKGNCKIENLTLNKKGNADVVKLYRNEKRYYDMETKGLKAVERYVVAIDSVGNSIRYVACDVADEIKYALATADEIAYEIGLESVEQLKFMNAAFSIDSGVLGIAIRDFKTGEDSVSTMSEQSLKTLKICEFTDRFEKKMSVHDGKVALSINYNGVYEANIPDGVEEIADVSGVNSLKAGEKTRKVLGYAFEDSDDILTFDGMNKVKQIGKCAFRNSTLKRVSNIKSVEYIGDEAFRQSNIRGELEIGARVIGKRAFSETPIKSVVLNGTVELGKGAFDSAYNLSKVDLGAELEIIDGHAFEGTQIKEVNIPQSCMYIAECAFKECTKLKVARVPRSAFIEDGAFDKRCRVELY